MSGVTAGSALQCGQMATFTTLRETEEAVAERIGDLPVDYAAMHALSNLHRAATATRTLLTHTVLRDRDVSWTGFVVLWSVWIYDGMPTWQAAESADISKATLTGVVRTLVGRGWLIREVDPSDRRMINLTLTDSGRQMMEEIFPDFNSVEADIVDTMSARELRALTTSLRKILERIEELDDRSSQDDGDSESA